MCNAYIYTTLTSSDKEDRPVVAFEKLTKCEGNGGVPSIPHLFRPGLHHTSLELFHVSTQSCYMIYIFDIKEKGK